MGSRYVDFQDFMMLNPDNSSELITRIGGPLSWPSWTASFHLVEEHVDVLLHG